jgi:hypothetical protein
MPVIPVDPEPVKTRSERFLGATRKTAGLGHDRLGRGVDRLKRGVASAADQGSQWVNAGLATEYAHPVDRWMGHLFTSRATIYDQAMDRVYRETHIGGGDHRLFDGGHDPIGAWEAVSHANPDDTFLHDLSAYFVAMWKDMATPNGMPIVTWDPDTFHAVSHAARGSNDCISPGPEQHRSNPQNDPRYPSSALVGGSGRKPNRRDEPGGSTQRVRPDPCIFHIET